MKSYLPPLRKNLVVGYLVLLALAGKAQYVTIPDAKFVTYLQANIPGCMNGNLMDTTSQAVLNAVTVDCNGRNISDLTGIQYFKTLDTLISYFNNLSSLPPLPSSLRYINCNSNPLTSLPQLPPSLTFLYCNGDMLTSLPPLPASLTYLNCTVNSLTSLPSLPSSLAFIYCNDNLLTSLPVLPSKLLYIDCSDNQLTQLPTLPDSLQTLYCGYFQYGSNFLTTLPALPSTLKELVCDGNLLHSLPRLPDSLTILDCSYNQFTTLPNLPGGLQSLGCANNNLSTLSHLPNSVWYLVCSNNQLSSLTFTPVMDYLDCSHNLLTSLPLLPNTLAQFYCDHNQIATLPDLPHSLFDFTCSNNLLTSLPNSISQTSLTGLSCDSNMLTDLPPLPSSLSYLRCASNNLLSLPPLPAEFGYFNVENNPSLTCLPPIKRVGPPTYGNNFFIGNTAILCLPNIIQHPGHIPSIDTMPICNFLNVFNCPLAWDLEAHVFNDANSDCIMQQSEQAMSNVKMSLYKNNVLVQSGLFNGDYTFVTDTGTYRLVIDTAGLPFYPTCGVDTTITLSASDTLITSVNFGLHCKPGFDVGVESITGSIARPGYLASVNIAAGDIEDKYGAECASISGTVTATLEGPVSYFRTSFGSRVPTSVTDSIITWNITDFDSVNFFNDFRIILKTDSTATIGEPICIRVDVIPITGDLVPENNTLRTCFYVSSSYDPNEKTVYPSGNIDTSTNWLTYTIYFQNTGNNTAINIQIIDTLNSNLDIESFSYLASSFGKPVIQVSGNGVVAFNFPNINLPDSGQNQSLSQGFIQYKVKLKNNLPIGTQIQNTAYIYFDFNTPVATNTTFNTISLSTGISELSLRQEPGLKVYPNPASQQLFISATSFTPEWVSVFDLGGRKVSQQRFTQVIDVASLTNGFYFIEVSDKNAAIRSRFVKF